MVVRGRALSFDCLAIYTAHVGIVSMVGVYDKPTIHYQSRNSRLLLTTKTSSDRVIAQIHAAESMNIILMDDNIQFDGSN